MVALEHEVTDTLALRPVGSDSRPTVGAAATVRPSGIRICIQRDDWLQ